MLSFDEFTDALYKAGWRADCDAQHTEVVAVYDEMVCESRKASQITALKAELAECKRDAERGWNAEQLKTGNIYRVIGEAIDSTNMHSNQLMVIYQRDGKTFVREAEEFQEKFKAIDAAMGAAE